MSNSSKLGKVQEFRTKPQTVEGVQYTGTNGSVVAEFVKYNGGKVRRSKSWMKVSLNGEDWIPLEVGDLVLQDHATIINVYSQAEIRKFFTVPKGVELM